MNTLKNLENDRLEEIKKYRVDDEKINKWRKRIKKVSKDDANVKGAQLLKILNDDEFDETDDSCLDKINDLIESGANLNYTDHRGNTLLINCVYKNFICVASMLLSCGADPNIENAREITPIRIACNLSRDEFLKLLIYNGADVNKRNSYGTTAIDELITTDGVITSNECLEILLQHNAIINGTDLNNHGIKDIDIIGSDMINFQRKKKKKIDYIELIKEAKSYLPNSDDDVEKKVKEEKNSTFKRVR